ncbi:MAG: glycosyltransferase family 9 protein [Chloroflexi bacterium]|nr:glycosyltransferase family 9 protein [Ktedonobacteraceae bacterium]MBV9707752.1 glycosyltransferase family 9 protein [Chloroflexota bacterium]
MKRLLRTLILLLILILGTPAAYVEARKACTKKTATPRILLIRPDHLGDLVLTTPVLQALRDHAPSAHISMMVGPWSSAVVARHPAIDQIIPCPFPGFQRAAQKALAPYILLLRTAQDIRRGRYDLAINLRPDFWWGAAMLYLAHVPRRIGYALAPTAPFLTHALPFQTAEHATVSALRLTSAGLRTLGLSSITEPHTPERYPLYFRPTREEETWVAERLQAEGVKSEDSIIVIHPGSGAPVKLWRHEAWAKCADVLSTDFPRAVPIRIILTGSEHERSLLEEIARGMKTAALLFTDTTVGQLAALLKRAYLVLGVDNGPLHLAVAQGTATIHIFGPTDARIFGPWGPAERHLVIASTRRCPTCPTIPCGRLDFSPQELAQHTCVGAVQEQQVLEAVRALNLFVEKDNVQTQ